MKIRFVSNGDVTRIPPIGKRMQIAPNLFFEVESYGESESTPCPDSNTGELISLELIGKLIIPAGSPMSTLEKLWGTGNIEDLLGDK